LIIKAIKNMYEESVIFYGIIDSLDTCLGYGGGIIIL